MSQIIRPPEQRRDLRVLYQKMNIGELRLYVPQVDWARYLTLVLARPVSTSEQVVIFALNYTQDLVMLLRNTPSRLAQ
jgi:hypothetical protein